MQEENRLEMKQISKSFPGVKALDNVDLVVKKGSVHVVVGENGAGKSTLMKILNGAFLPDSGTILFDGKPVIIKDTITAINLGISMIHQELNPIKEMTIAENLFLGREPCRKLKTFINWKELFNRARELLRSQGLNYDPKMKLRDMSVSDIQLLEIVKALSYNASLIIMDEPTSSITESEVKILFKRIREIKESGISIIYISHKLDEVFAIADEVTVLRDGKKIDTKPINELDKNSIITMMVGRSISDVYPKTHVDIGEKQFEVIGLEKKGVFNDISFEIRKGEILGVAGLVGAGRTEIARAIFGLDECDSGVIKLADKDLGVIKSCRKSIKNGIVMTSEDRKRYGLIPTRSVRENISLPNIESYIRWLIIRKKLEKKACSGISEKLSIKTPSLETIVNSLSGGNQQKVILAKWLLSNPKVLILDEPTRGIDVGAKYEIYKLVCILAEQGISIMMISSELPELIGICDRIIVINRGRISGEVSGALATQENIMALATGGR